MAEAKEALLKFWQNKKARDITILSIIVVVLIFSLIHCFNAIVEQTRTDTVAKIFICTQCEYLGIMEIDEITEVKCPKCSSPVGYGWKCRSCSREFSVRPQKITRVMTKKELIAKKRMETRCPNCESFDTYPFPTTLVK